MTLVDNNINAILMLHNTVFSKDILAFVTSVIAFYFHLLLYFCGERVLGKCA